MWKKSESLIHPDDRTLGVFRGLSLTRSPPIHGYPTELVIPYETSTFKEWAIFKQKQLLGRFGVDYYAPDGDGDVILLPPLGPPKERDTLQSLGYKILNDHPGWCGTIRPFGDIVEVEGLIEWGNYILSRYTTQLRHAGILGGVVVSRGKYNKNTNIIKALVELWCSETNTFHLPYGEIGISLWEIRELSGLPITGDMYDEYIPLNSELYNKNSYPNCLRELFDIYQWLVPRSSHKHVRYDLWVNFFYKKSSRSRSQNISNRERAPSYTEVTTLAAFISLWLCNFVMPSGLDHFIRPETFVMASKLALGERVALVPAILCAIHIGLSFMSDHPEGPAHPGPQFPVSFLYAWIGLHFEQTYSRKTLSDSIKNIAGLRSPPHMVFFMDAAASPFNAKRARIHLRSSAYFVWRPLPYSYSFVNDGWLYDAKLSTGDYKYPKEVYEYIISIRQSMLPLRLGNKLHTQPYNPHRFARQFGFDQFFPERINIPRLADNLGTLAGCWNHFIRHGDSTNYFVPKEDRIGRPTLHYARWWSNSVHSSFKHGINYLLLADDPRKKKTSVAISKKDSLPEKRSTSSRVIGERALNPLESKGKQLALFPEYDHIQVDLSDDSPQREVIGLSFPIHEDDRSKGVHIMDLTTADEVHLLDSSTRSKVCTVEPSENPSPDTLTEVARGKLLITVPSITEPQIGKSGSIEDDDELADHVSIPSPSKCTEDPLADVADIGVSYFNETFLTHHEDEKSGDKNKAATEMPPLGKRERTSDISTKEAHKKAHLETNLDSSGSQIGSKPTDDPEDVPPYGDEVDYEFTPSPPEDIPSDENAIVRFDSGAGGSRREIPIVAKSFLTDRIMKVMKTFDRRQFKSAQEEVSEYCQCLSELGINTSELEERIKPIFDHAEVIEELASSPNFVPIVQLMEADEELALSRRKLASHRANRDSLLHATENVSSQLQRTREKIKELEESISHLKITEAQLSLKLAVADDSLKKLQPSQEEELQQDVVNAEKKHAAAAEVYNVSKESAGLRELIESFEKRRQLFEI